MRLVFVSIRSFAKYLKRSDLKRNDVSAVRSQTTSQGSKGVCPRRSGYREPPADLILRSDQSGRGAIIRSAFLAPTTSTLRVRRRDRAGPRLPCGSPRPRSEGYGYQVKAGQIDCVVDRLHGSRGVFGENSAAGFARSKRLASRTFSSAVAVKGQIEGPITLSAYLFHRDRSFLSDSVLFAATAFHVS
jgi:hypothetical protein